MPGDIKHLDDALLIVIKTQNFIARQLEQIEYTHFRQLIEAAFSLVEK